MKHGEAVRDGIGAIVKPMFGAKMPDWWYQGMADTDDMAALYKDIG